jgi:hypothetical protein
MTMQNQRFPQAGCYATARFWRAHAQLLRDNAQVSYLNDTQRQVLEREAEAADQRADRWLDAAVEQ